MTAPDDAAAIEIVRHDPSRSAALLHFLERLAVTAEAAWFRPHPFTADHVRGIAMPSVRDLHYLLVRGAEVIGYGLLRGWDEGYDVPSLGIAIHPDHRGLGLGMTLMQFLHSAARMRGCARVRLRVSDGNAAGIMLYERMGYRFEDFEDRSPSGRLIVAFKELRN